MSLPPAHKEISEHPAPDSVAVPTNKQLKEADVDRKVDGSERPPFQFQKIERIFQIRFYGVIQAFRQGRMPDNKQIDDTLNYVKDHSPVELDKLSPEGRKLVQDSRDIIETARLIVKVKNSDELFQNFIWHTRDVNLDIPRQRYRDALPADEQKAREDSQQGMSYRYLSD